MTSIFSDPTKFQKLDNDPSLTQLSSLQEYLCTIHKRNEIDDIAYRNIQPQSIRPARAHGLPKTHKPFDYLPSFRPTRGRGIFFFFFSIPMGIEFLIKK
jgi:hypothetical protein